jgi:Calx-beta domain-containing protein
MVVSYRQIMGNTGLKLARFLGLVLLLFVSSQIAFAQTPTIKINDLVVPEGDDPVILFGWEFQVTLSAPSANQVKVTASTQAGTATDNVDFGAGSADIIFQPGETKKTLTVFIKGDTLVEGTENFLVNLSNPVNATIADGQGEVTIIDDDTLLLVTQPGSTRAAAVDSTFVTRDVFSIANTINFSSDSTTRISVFAIGLKLAAGETASAVTATAEDSQGTMLPLTVEVVSKVPNFTWLTQVVLKLNNQLTVAQDVKIRITVHGVTSNAVLVGVKP